MRETVTVNGAELRLDPSGALIWPARHLLVVADLHLEKGSSFAERGRFLPPYDTRATLDALEAVIARETPERVICLGDSFHDATAENRVTVEDAARLRTLTEGRDWIWIAGNHDPDPPAAWGGQVRDELSLGALIFRHQARTICHAPGEISGHFHPKACLRLRARRLTARCFVTDGKRLILPAFGAYTGGLDVRAPEIRSLFPGGFRIHALGRAAVYPFPETALAS